MGTQQQTSQPTSQPTLTFYHPCLLCSGLDEKCPGAPKACVGCGKALDPHSNKNRKTCGQRCRKRLQSRLSGKP